MGRRGSLGSALGLCGLLSFFKNKKKLRSCVVGFPGGTSGKEPACQCRRLKRHRFDPWVGKIQPRRRAWQPTPVFFPGESHGQRSLEGYSQWDRRESDLTEATQPACMCIRVGDINHVHVWQRP